MGFMDSGIMLDLMHKYVLYLRHNIFYVTNMDNLQLYYREYSYRAGDNIFILIIISWRATVSLRFVLRAK